MRIRSAEETERKEPTSCSKSRKQFQPRDTKIQSGEGDAYPGPKKQVTLNSFYCIIWRKWLYVGRFWTENRVGFYSKYLMGKLLKLLTTPIS